MNSRPKYPLEDHEGSNNTGPGIGRGPEASDLEFDQEWIQLAQLDLEKFSKLYRKYQPKIYAFICWMVKDTDIASDLTDETFFQALDRLDSFKWRGVTVGAWFFRIARNLVAMEFKRQRIESENPCDQDFLDLALVRRPDLDLIQEEETRLLEECLDKLPMNYKEVIVNYYGLSLTTKETGMVLDIPEGTVKTYLQRGREQLRHCLIAKGMDGDLSDYSVKIIRESAFREEGWGVLEGDGGDNTERKPKAGD